MTILIAWQDFTAIKTYCIGIEESPSLTHQPPATITPNKSQNISVLNQEDIIRGTRKGLDRSISILTLVATLMGVLVGLITLILLIVTALGILEERRWKALREKTDKMAKEVEYKFKNIEKAAEIVERLRNKAEKDAETLGQEIDR